MNDWSNDTLQVGDLVRIYVGPPGYMRDCGIDSKGYGVVTSLDTPPRGSLQTYNVTVLTPGGLITTYRQCLEKLDNDL